MQRLWHRFGHAARPRHSDAGFTLLEVVVAFSIFAVVASAAVVAIVNGINVSDYTSDRVQAANVAQAVLQQARADPAAVIATPTPSPSTTSVGGKPFVVARTAVVPAGCPAGGSIPVTVVVSWTNGSSRQVRMDTVIAC